MHTETPALYPHLPKRATHGRCRNYAQKIAFSCARRATGANNRYIAEARRKHEPSTQFRKGHRATGAQAPTHVHLPPHCTHFRPRSDVYSASGKFAGAAADALWSRVDQVAQAAKGLCLGSLITSRFVSNHL